MKSPNSELSVLLKKVSWIASGVVGFGVVVGAVLLALDAPPGDPPALSKKARRGKGKRAKSRYVKPKRSGKYPRPMLATPKRAERSERAPDGRDRPAGGPRPDRLSEKVRAIMRPGRPPAYTAGRVRQGRLSKEELEKRRDERRKRQVERLRKRIQTLEDRIDSYKQDGTRTEAQISRMERSLDRMKRRLKRMEEQQNR